MAKSKTSRKPAKAPKPKSGTERTIDSLKERLEADRVSHALAIAAKNQALEEANTNSILFELADSYPHLRELITLLRRAHTAASPLRSSGSGGSRSAEYFSPPERGILPTADRSRITWIDRKLEALAVEIEKGMKPRGPLTDELRPQCWNPDCPQAGWHQPFERSIDYGGPGTCTSCGDDFGAHNPYKDKSKDHRCWERGCPEYSHVDKCVHSWQKMGVPA